MKHPRFHARVARLGGLAVGRAMGASPCDDRRTEQGHDDHRAAPARDDHTRGAGPDHSWHKGDRIPASYRDKRYEVTDWKARHLRQPPRGYHWVQVNGNFVLAAVATGVIADLLLND